MPETTATFSGGSASSAIARWNETSTQMVAASRTPDRLDGGFVVGGLEFARASAYSCLRSLTM